MKLWGGRFTKSTDTMVDDFHSSIRFDSRLYKYDILGSVAHVKMLGKCNIIPMDDVDLIEKTLNEILDDIEGGKVQFEIDAEDIHMNIEKILISRIGDPGKKLHTGRSRNDQVALDIRLYLKDEIDTLKELVISLMEALVDISKKHTKTIMPGYTHLQKAQPITFAHHLMAYTQMFQRDFERLCDCYKRINVMPLGSGALAGNPYPIDRYFIAAELGFPEITYNSLDGVSDRDFVIELSSDLSIIMMHLSRFCEELILWSTGEFDFVEMDDAYSTGSSIMPQKKNPDVAELIRGKTGRVYGSLVGILTVMKGLPLAYNKDMQEDKEPLFDAIDTVKLCLPIFTKMLSTMKVKSESMYKKASQGFTNATDFADYLTKKGLPFREAHEVVGKLVLHCVKEMKAIDELSLEELRTFSSIIEDDIYEKISIEACVEARNIPGGPAAQAVLQSICLVEDFFNKNKINN